MHKHAIDMPSMLTGFGAPLMQTRNRSNSERGHCGTVHTLYTVHYTVLIMHSILQVSTHSFKPLARHCQVVITAAAAEAVAVAVGGAGAGAGLRCHLLLREARETTAMVRRLLTDCTTIHSLHTLYRQWHADY
jgi:hypothetical protein